MKAPVILQVSIDAELYTQTEIDDIIEQFTRSGNSDEGFSVRLLRPELMGTSLMSATMAKKIVAVMNEAPEIQKAIISYPARGGQREFPAYTDDDIMSVIKPYLAKNGLVVWPTEGEWYTDTVIQTRYDKSKSASVEVQIEATVIPFKFTLIDSDTGESVDNIVRQPLPDNLNTLVANKNSARTFARKEFVRFTFGVSAGGKNEEQSLAEDTRERAAGDPPQNLTLVITSIDKTGNNILASATDVTGNPHSLPLSSGAITALERMLGQGQGAMMAILNEGILKFNAKYPLHLNVVLQNGRYTLRPDQNKGLSNPAVASVLTSISGITEEDLVAILGVNALDEFSGDLSTALDVVHKAQSQSESIEEYSEKLGGVVAES